MQMICAMGPSGGGRNSITPRFLRHFNVIGITEFDKDSYVSIYANVMKWWQNKNDIIINELISDDVIVNMTIDIYHGIKEKLLPTPNKSHYLYNMRDLSKVFQVIINLNIVCLIEWKRAYLCVARR